MNSSVKKITVAAAIICSVLLGGCDSKGPSTQSSKAGNNQTSQASAAEFFKGKVLSIIVPYGPGGGYDQWARLISPYMQKYLGVSKVLVVNQPGGGGLVGTGKIYSAAPDGLTIGDTNAAGDVFSQLAKNAGVSFDVQKFNWLGRPDDDPHIIAVHLDGPYKSFSDLLQASAHGTTLKSLATGAGSSDYNAAVITLNSFKTRFQMVAAFSGSSSEKAAFLGGNGDTMSVSASDIAQIAQHAKPVLLIADEPFGKLADVPTVIDVAKKQNLPDSSIKLLHALVGVMAMGHAFFAPPGVPADRLAALRSAFQKSLADKEFVAATQKADLYLGYAPAAALEQETDTAMADGALFQPLLTASK
ncbi:tripartite tricarboxylate transporter family receptor [mine drainage metagenome]|uniref:Tripartite tricarboxylate transporter family receptor n=1 Tax=mine drainage metagenome TaxID=410659 RepID=A0A1J5S3E3_9ZZZZ